MNTKEEYADYTRKVSKLQGDILRAEMKIFKLKKDYKKNAQEIQRLTEEIERAKKSIQ